MTRLAIPQLKILANRLLWLGPSMIQNASHLRPKTDGMKAGGHQASCASMVTLMTKLYFNTLSPQDRVAVKPHAGPVFHAIQYIFGNQSLEKLKNFRGFGGAQSYPSRTKDTADVDFSTGSVGLGVTSFEPAFADKLACIMEWAFAYIHHNAGKADGADWQREAGGGSVSQRLSTRSLEQPKRSPDAIRKGVIDGAYWLRAPGPNCEVVIAYQGTVATEAIAAAALLSEGRRDAGILAVTSADRLNAGWQAAQTARINGRLAVSHIEGLLAQLSRDSLLVTVFDGHPATLSWLGSVHGHRVAGMGVEHFGQTGTVADLYRHFGIDRHSILRVVAGLAPDRPLRAVGGN